MFDLNGTSASHLGPHVCACACAQVCVHTWLFSTWVLRIKPRSLCLQETLIELWPQPHLGHLMISFPRRKTVAPRHLPGLQLPLSLVPHPPFMEPSGVEKNLLLHRHCSSLSSVALQGSRSWEHILFVHSCLPRDLTWEGCLIPHAESVTKAHAYAPERSGLPGR